MRSYATWCIVFTLVLALIALAAVLITRAHH